MRAGTAATAAVSMVPKQRGDKTATAAKLLFYKWKELLTFHPPPARLQLANQPERVPTREGRGGEGDGSEAFSGQA